MLRYVRKKKNRDVLPPSTPTGLTVVKQSSSFHVTWNASTDASGIALYETTMDGAASYTGLSLSYDTYAGSLPVGSYAFRVRAKDTVGNYSAWSAIAYGVIPDTSAPTVPTQNAATSVTSSSFTLNWSGSTDNVGVAGYQIFLNGSHYDSVSSGVFSYTVNGRVAGTTYTAQIKAYDAASNLSALSNQISVTTTAITWPSSWTLGKRITYSAATGFGNTQTFTAPFTVRFVRVVDNKAAATPSVWNPYNNEPDSVLKGAGIVANFSGGAGTNGSWYGNASMTNLQILVAKAWSYSGANYWGNNYDRGREYRLALQYPISAGATVNCGFLEGPEGDNSGNIDISVYVAA